MGRATIGQQSIDIMDDCQHLFRSRQKLGTSTRCRLSRCGFGLIDSSSENGSIEFIEHGTTFNIACIIGRQLHHRRILEHRTRDLLSPMESSARSSCPISVHYDETTEWASQSIWNCTRPVTQDSRSLQKASRRSGTTNDMSQGSRDRLAQP